MVNSEAHHVFHAKADNLFGRFDGDVAFQVGANGHIEEGAGTPQGGLGLDLRALYLASAGVFAQCGLKPANAQPLQEQLWCTWGVDLRPLFMARFFLNKESGDPFWDLLLDSFSMELGIRYDSGWHHPHLHGGLAIQLPWMALFTQKAEGLSTRFSTYMIHNGEPQRTQWGVSLGIVWTAFVQTGLVNTEHLHERNR